MHLPGKLNVIDPTSIGSQPEGNLLKPVSIDAALVIGLTFDEMALFARRIFHFPQHPQTPIHSFLLEIFDISDIHHPPWEDHFQGWVVEAHAAQRLGGWLSNVVFKGGKSGNLTAGIFPWPKTSS